MLSLVAPGLDLFGMVGGTSTPAIVALLASSAAAAALLMVYVRYPRTSWLPAAVLATCASLALRLIGADGAPLMALLGILALGTGGAFATSRADAASLLA